MRQMLQKFPSVSIVVTVYNAERTINKCLDSIMKLERFNDKLDVVVIDDGSTDNSANLVSKYPVRLIQKKQGGYPSAMNTGIRAAHGEIVVIVDSDIYVARDWLTKILEEFNDPKVGIVSGYVATAPTKKFWAKLAGYELEARYRKLKTKYVDHISSTCTAYRKKLFNDIGFFNELLKRDSDENLAHRAHRKGWKIVFRKDAKCFHTWKGSLKSYFKQQLNDARYAVKIIREAPELLRGKKIQPVSLYVPVVLTFLLFLTPLYFLLSYVWLGPLLFICLVLYHVPSTIRVLHNHRDFVMLLFPLAINVRYIAWILGFAKGVMSEAAAYDFSHRSKHLHSE